MQSVRRHAIQAVIAGQAVGLLDLMLIAARTRKRRANPALRPGACAAILYPGLPGARSGIGEDRCRALQTSAKNVQNRR